MKRILIVCMVLGLLIGTVASAEARAQRKRVERTVEASYGPYPAPVLGCSDPLGPWACIEIATGSNDAFLTAKVTDAHGQPVFVQVTNGGGGTVATFCGETSKPIALDPGAGLRIYLSIPLWPLELHLDCPAHRIKTTGTISLTLSNLP